MKGLVGPICGAQYGCPRKLGDVPSGECDGANEPDAIVAGEAGWADEGVGDGSVESAVDSSGEGSSRD